MAHEQAAWECALPWLFHFNRDGYGNAITAAQAKEAITYFKRNPQQITRQSVEGSLPLQCAICLQGSKYGAVLVTGLLKAYPRALREVDSDGSLPLHMATVIMNMAYGRTMFEEVLKAFPEAAQHKDEEGELPLHVAAWCKDPQIRLELITMLFEAYPEAALQKDSSGYTPLHSAARFKSNPAILVTLLNACPQAAREQDHHGYFPLHLALEFHQSGLDCLEKVTALLAEYPQAAEQDTLELADGLALHLAARYQIGEHSVAVVKAVLAAYPEAARHYNSEFELPLHVAAQYQTGPYSAAVVTALLMAYPEAAWQPEPEDPDDPDDPDCRLPLPLHCAAKNQTTSFSVDVVTTLLAAYPEAAQIPSVIGQLPLHIAAEYQKGEQSVAVMKALIAAHPAATQQQDRLKRLPLHEAAMSQRHANGAAVVRLVLAACPKAALHMDRGGCLPLHLAALHQHEEFGAAVVMALIAACPESIRAKNKKRCLPLHLAACRKAKDEELSLEAVKVLVAAYPPALRQKDSVGMSPLEVAQEENAADRSLVEFLQAAAEGQWQPPPSEFGPRRLTSAHTALTFGPNPVAAAVPVEDLTMRDVEVLSRRARLLAEHSDSDCDSDSDSDSDSGDPLAAVALAASTLAAEGRLPAAAAILQQAAPLLRELLAAVQVPQQPAPGLYGVEALAAAAEDAATRLRACHGALMSHVSATPPPVAVAAALVDARDAALTAAQAASRALRQAVLENDMDAIAAKRTAAADELSALLDRMLTATGIAIDTEGVSDDGFADGVAGGAADGVAGGAADGVADSAAPVAGSSKRSALPPSTANGPAATEEPHAADSAWLEKAMQRLNNFSAKASKLLSRLSTLPPISWASLGDSDTQPSRAALKALRDLTHALLLPGNEPTDLCHYLAYVAPWKTACTQLAARNSALRREADAASRVVVTAQQLSEESDRWAAALEERHDKTTQLEAAHGALRKARRVLLHAQADAADAQSGDDSDTEKDCDRVRVARQRCRRACVARDAAANTILAFAVAYCPEVLVQQRKRLMPGGLPTVVSQRSRSDYDNVGPLDRAGEGRHTLLSATFEDVRCVLKVVPLSKGNALVREADILKQVKHPNIVELLSIFVENDVAYLHMTHASHGDLEHFLTLEAAAAAAANTSTRPPAAVLPPYQLQRMGRQLCEAVAYLTERSIVHCDIKPANVFVDGDRGDDSLRVVLGDFDVSHTATGRTTTLTRAVSGIATHYTPGYAPPEVLFATPRQPPRVSSAIDVYGLGCVLFAMHMHPRKLPEPASISDAVASKEELFATPALPPFPAPAVSVWATTVPREVVQAATRADPRARASVRELLHTRYMLDASYPLAHIAIQRPAYWLHQTHTGSWLEAENEDVRVAVETALNATAEPATHGVGRDSHGERFQRFKVTGVQRLEHSAVWAAYAAHRRQLADALLAEHYTPPCDIEPLATEGTFAYPLEGCSLEAAAGEVFLFHGASKPESIASSGFDVRYAFAGAGAGAMFGRGVYFAESASKADQYVGRDGTRPLTMVVARVLLGRTAQVSATRYRAPFLPEVAEKNSVEVPVYYDSIVADMRPQGLRFREVVVGEGSRAYPELLVEYERV